MYEAYDKAQASFDAAWLYSGRADPVGDDFFDIFDLTDETFRAAMIVTMEHVADMYRLSGMIG